MIVEALNLFMIPQHVEMQAVLPDNDEERLLLKLISHEPCHVDELIRGSGLATTTVSSTLMMMMEIIAQFWYERRLQTDR